MSHQGTWANALVKQEWSKLLIHNLKHIHTNFTYRILLSFKTHSNVMYLIYSQFPLISHLIISCEHIKSCLSITPRVIKISAQKTDPDWVIDLITTEELQGQNHAQWGRQGGGEPSLTQVHPRARRVTGSSGVNGSRTTSTLYSCMTTKLNQMEYQVTCIFFLHSTN